MSTLHLNHRLRQSLERLALSAYPEESCGILIGQQSADGVTLEEITQARNLNQERARDRYQLDPDDYFKADLYARELHQEIVGIWHTHPDHPAIPSATDLAAAWEGWSYIILSVSHEGTRELRSWRLDGNGFAEEVIAS